MYVDFVNGHTRYLGKYLWKLKVALKIKYFMLFLHRKVLLTKDNLIKRQCTGCTRCVGCNAQESIEHLSISRPFAKSVWRLVHFAFNISSRANITNIFCSWVNGIDKKVKARIRVEVYAL
jgi:hypothetical protein